MAAQLLIYRGKVISSLTKLDVCICRHPFDATHIDIPGCPASGIAGFNRRVEDPR